MTQIRKVDVLVVGAGPAGMSTALHLVQADPEWAERVVVIDKAVHPREKPCGGGVTQFGETILGNLGLSFEPPHVPVNEVRIIFGDRVFAVRGTPAFRVVRRDEFDYWLVSSGEKRGIAVRQGEAAKAITPYADYFEVITDQTAFHAKIVVAADGSSSFVRRQLKWDGKARVAHALEILTPEVAEQRSEFRDGVAVYDFSQTMNGLQGYYWDFPSLIGGQPFMNRGVFDSRVHPERSSTPLKQVFEEALSKRGCKLSDYTLKGHTIRWFTVEENFSRPRLLLAGDAAGVDPLLGEGISFALAYGEVSSTQILDAYARQDFGMADYKERILAHPLLKQLRMRTKGARFLHRLAQYPWLAQRLWDAAPLMFGMLARYKPRYIPVSQPRMIRLPN